MMIRLYILMPTLIRPSASVASGVIASVIQMVTKIAFASNQSIESIVGVQVAQLLVGVRDRAPAEL